MMEKIILLTILVVTVCTGCAKKTFEYPEHTPVHQLSEEERNGYIQMYEGIEEITLEDGTVVTIDDFILLGRQQDRARTYRSTPEGQIIYAADYDSFIDYLNNAFDEEARTTFLENEEKYMEWNQAWMDALAQHEESAHDHTEDAQ